MTKITYDLNDETAVKLVDEYYFFKYYVKTIISDWARLYERECEIYGEQSFTIKFLLRQIFNNHINKIEFKRLRENVSFHGEYSLYTDIDDDELLRRMIKCGNNHICCDKFLLVKRFGSKI